MTAAPGEITARQLRDELIASMRPKINVRPGRTHNEMIVEWTVPVYDIRLTITPPRAEDRP